MTSHSNRSPEIDPGARTTHDLGRRSVLRAAAAGAAAAATVGALPQIAGATTPTAARPRPSTPANLPPGDLSHGADNFYVSDRVVVHDVAFPNQYGMKVTGNLFVPKGLRPGRRRPAMVVGHPMGAVKEQSANLYATKLAEQGFVTMSIDLSFWGGSAGRPRNAVSPDIYAEDFSAAVDFLRAHPRVHGDRVGALGICGSGSFVVSAAKIDPRIRAVATVTMYDMGAVNRDGLRNSVSLRQRKAALVEAAEQRDVEFAGGETLYTAGTPERLDSNSTAVEREFFDFYRTARGYSPHTTTMPTLTSNAKFMNFYPFDDIASISPRPMLFVTGENAHSREFSEDAYRLAKDPKELVVVPGAGHVDLYDRVNLIPFDRLTAFFRRSLS